MSEPEFAADLKRIESKTRELLSKIIKHPNVSQSRQLGTIGAIKLAEGGYFAGNKLDIPALARREGVLLRPLGNVLYAMPPQQPMSSSKRSTA